MDSGIIWQNYKHGSGRKHMLIKAVDWEWATEKTLKQVRKVKFVKEKNRRLRFLDVEECQRLIEYCASY